MDEPPDPVFVCDIIHNAISAERQVTLIGGHIKIEVTNDRINEGQTGGDMEIKKEDIIVDIKQEPEGSPPRSDSSAEGSDDSFEIPGVLRGNIQDTQDNAFYTQNTVVGVVNNTNVYNTENGCTNTQGVSSAIGEYHGIESNIDSHLSPNSHGSWSHTTCHSRRSRSKAFSDPKGPGIPTSSANLVEDIMNQLASPRRLEAPTLVQFRQEIVIAPIENSDSDNSVQRSSTEDITSADSAIASRNSEIDIAPIQHGVNNSDKDDSTNKQTGVSMTSGVCGNAQLNICGSEMQQLLSSIEPVLVEIIPGMSKISLS